MNDKRIQSILQDAVNEALPASQIDIWKKVKASLVTGNQIPLQQGAKMNTSKLRQRLVVAVFTVIGMVAAAFATPQGRAFAQDFISQFFTRTESDTFYMEPSDLTFEDTTPFHEQCGIPIFPTCSVEQVRGMVDFEIQEIGAIPDMMLYVGATGGPDYIELKYGYEDRRDGNLSVIVEAIDRPSMIGTGIAAKSAPIQAAQIGDLPGEYYTGVLFQDDQGNVAWNPNDPTATLRWEDNGSTYTLTYYSTTIPLTKDELIAIAESMTLGPVEKRPLPPGFVR